MEEFNMSHSAERSGDEHYVVISTDGHCGADLWDYKPYLDARYHEDFDDWARSYHDAWAEIDTAMPIDRRIGIASFENPINWDSGARLKLTEEQGFVAEVLLPNTSPPFFPSGAITAPGPRDRREYEYRFAGLKAHNRWLAEFCADAPGRRAGLAQVFLDDIDAAVAEVRWAKEAGLRGVLLPADHQVKMTALYHPKYDALWAVCEELGLPVHRHTIKHTESIADGGPGAPLIGSFESEFFSARAFVHMILAGVFERFPGLKLVGTEMVAACILIPYFSKMDSLVDNAVWAVGGKGLAGASKKPSEYFVSNCYVGGPLDLRQAYRQGVPNLMWGSDLPHGEGTSPYTLEALRAVFAGAPEPDVREILSTRPAELYGFDLDVLQPLADQFGPTVAEVSEPLKPHEIPDYPSETRGFAFAEFAGVQVHAMMDA